MQNAAAIKNTVSEVVNALNAGVGFNPDSYFRQDREAFIRDVETAVLNRWQSGKIKERYGNLPSFVEKVAIVFDRYALELYRFFLPADLSRPQSSPLFRAAHQMINRYGRLGAVFSPDDALMVTLEAILIKDLAILQFNGHSSLKTWVTAVLHNIILMQARKEGIIGERARPGVASLYEQVFDEGPTNLEICRDHNLGQPEREYEHSEWLSRGLKFLINMARQGNEELTGLPEEKGSPKLERAWILWNDYIADFYIEYTDLVGENHEFAPLPFPLPPPEIVSLSKKGGHNPDYSDYLARRIGTLRRWTGENIEADLALSRTPKDDSRLRAAVRMRRNEAKMTLVKELQGK